jgi:hypothetical protein
MSPLEKLMQQVVAAVDAVMDLMCADPTHTSGSLSESAGIDFLDVVVAASDRDEKTLRDQGIDTALATVAAQIGTRSGLATVSIQIT